MLSCKDATELMSQRQDQPLGLMAQIRLQLHLAMCVGCRRFDQQMNFLRQATSCREGKSQEPQDTL